MARDEFVSTAFARELIGHMRGWRRGRGQSAEPVFASWLDGIYPELRDPAEALVTNGLRLHDCAHAATSSQAFALNLFLPYREGRRDELARWLGRLLGASLTIDQVDFEWIPPGAVLGEIDGDLPRRKEPATAVDVVLWGRTADDQRAAVLIEVKLTEDGFTSCGGAKSASNHRRDVCASAEKFFDEPSACYLHHPVGKARPRRYWSIFERDAGSVRAAFPGASLEGECPFRGQAQQPMRNLAIARAPSRKGEWLVLGSGSAPTTTTRTWRGTGLLGAPSSRRQRSRRSFPHPRFSQPAATPVLPRGLPGWPTDTD